MDSLLNTAPCGYLAFDDDGTILEANETLAGLLGYAPNQLRGGRVDTLMSVASRIFYQTHLFPLLKLSGAAEEIYMTLRTRGGDDIPVLANAIRRERDGATMNECVFVRMLQRAQFEDELVRAKRAAEAASDAKAKFLSMMSHELRTPLQAISGYCELLLAAGLTGEQSDDVQAIKSATAELVRLLNDILDFARVESRAAKIEIENVSVDAALTRAETLIAPRLAEAELNYSRAACSADLVVRANADRLQQVLLNLLTNAMKFTPRGGTIRVECQSDDEWTSIAIVDSGCGISSEHLASIFEPFVQVDRDRVAQRQRGVGLGLAICRELVQAMGGQLSVTSEVGAGSAFTVSLPTGQRREAATRSVAT